MKITLLLFEDIPSWIEAYAKGPSAFLPSYTARRESKSKEVWGGTQKILHFPPSQAARKGSGGPFASSHTALLLHGGVGRAIS